MMRLVLLVMVAPVAAAPALADDLEDCRRKGTGPEQRVAACTRVIDSGRHRTYAKRMMALHMSRSSAFIVIAESYYKKWEETIESKYDGDFKKNYATMESIHGKGMADLDMAHSFAETSAHKDIIKQHSNAQQNLLTKNLKLKALKENALGGGFFEWHSCTNEAADGLDSAIESCTIFLSEDFKERRVHAYVYRAHAWLRKGRKEQAISDFKMAVSLPASTSGAKVAKAEVERQLALLSAGPTRRIALVIGNSTYTSVARLANPANDAKEIASALRRIGFADVTEHYDLGYRVLREALKAFGDKAGAADWAVVYFAGHGIQVNQTTYLIPTDAKLARAAHVEDEAVALPYVLSKVEEPRKLRLVIIDACRDNPFLARMVETAGTRAVGRGLGRIEPERGILVAYAARDGQLALDGSEKHSPFTKALLEHIEEPGLEIGLLFRKVRDSVLKLTGSAQEPFVYGSLPSEGLYFKAAAR